MDRHPALQLEKTEAEHHLEYERCWQKLVTAAQEERQHSESHRSFKVGCAMLAWNGKRYEIFAGSNFKPHKNDKTVCAEKEALRKIRENGFERVIAIVVVSQHSHTEPTQEDSTKTLSPCAECQQMFRDAQEIKPTTILTTINDSNMDTANQSGGIIQERTVADVIK